MSESRELQSAAVAEYSRPSVYTADQPHAAASRVASLHAQYGATTATINMCPVCSDLRDGSTTVLC